MSVVTAALRYHGMRMLLYVDDLLITCSTFEEASRTRHIIQETLLPCRRHSPFATQGLLRYSHADPAGPDHLGFIISIIGKEAFRVPERSSLYAALSSARAARHQARCFEAAKNRRLVDSDLLRRFAGAAISCLPSVPLARFHLREVFNSQKQYKPRSFLLIRLLPQQSSGPENLQELWPDQASTALYTDTSGITGWDSMLQPPHEATRSSAGWWVSQ
jgi:hypothetical protein